MLAAFEDLQSAFTGSSLPNADFAGAFLKSVSDESVWAGQYLDWYRVDAQPPFAHFLTALPTAVAGKQAGSSVGR